MYLATKRWLKWVDSNCFSTHLNLQLWLFAGFVNMLESKNLGSNEEAVTDIEAYFDGKDKSFY